MTVPISVQTNRLRILSTAIVTWGRPTSHIQIAAAVSRRMNDIVKVVTTLLGISVMAVVGVHMLGSIDSSIDCQSLQDEWIKICEDVKMQNMQNNFRLVAMVGLPMTAIVIISLKNLM